MKWYSYDLRDFTETEYEFWYSQMSPEKRMRVDRFRFTEDKRRSAAGEMLAKKGIAAWCGVPTAQIHFAVSDSGKPYAPGLDVEFSISHSGNLIVCAVDDQPVGIDAERIRPIDLAAAQHFCTKEELRYLFGHTPVENELAYTEDDVLLNRFFDLWTKKEALGKRSGRVNLRADVSGIAFLTYRIGDYAVAICAASAERIQHCLNR